MPRHPAQRGERGSAAHATATYFSTGHMTKRIYSYFETQMQERYGQDWLYNSQEKSSSKITGKLPKNSLTR
jgi:hypothetical protein